MQENTVTLWDNSSDGYVPFSEIQLFIDEETPVQEVKNPPISQDVRAAIEKHERIILTIVDFWNRPKDFRDFVRPLLMMAPRYNPKTGKIEEMRQGFSPEEMDDLILLTAIHASVFWDETMEDVKNGSKDPWSEHFIK